MIMASREGSLDADEASFFDPAHPFRGVVVCCTSIPPELRSDIAAKTAELGGIHKYDLTPDCTHLVVGEYDTPKYRHVAKERPDVKAMSASWIEAVRDLWVEDADIDFVALERQWQLRTFETNGGEPTPEHPTLERGRLLCCMTGFDDPDVRQQIADKIEANGGTYTGDLTRRVTHLIVYKPEGRKYQAAKNWGIQTVSIEWVNDSVERGMILDEKCYDPILAPGERGVGAWNKNSTRRVSLGKRLRDASAANPDEGRRKLRKTASMKLNTQRDNLWGDILRKPQVAEPAPPGVVAVVPGQPNASASNRQLPGGTGKSMDTQGIKISSLGPPDDSAIFASCCFYIHGFSENKAEILANAIGSLGGLVCHSLDEVTSTSGAQLAHRFLVVPQNSAPELHPTLPDNVHIITEFYIERCLHKKYFFGPSEHVIGRPFAAFPIPGFEKLSICTAGFTGVDLNQVDKAIRQLGGKYEEKFTSQISVLVCSSLPVVRKQKLDLALAWKVPVVSADWLWECISMGYNVPLKTFLFPELKQKIGTGRKEATVAKAKGGQELIDKDLLPKAPPTHAKPKIRGFDYSASLREAFKDASSSKKQEAAAEQESNATTHFDTAPTHQLQTDNNTISMRDSSNSSSSGKKSAASAPLSEASSNSLNKTQQQPPPSPRKHDNQPQPQQQLPRKPMSRITSEIADSEATDGDICTPDEVPLDEDENNNQPQHQKEEEVEEDGEEVEKRRIAAEKAAERLALSTKLASILDSTTPTAAAAAPALITAGSESGGVGADDARDDHSMMARVASGVGSAAGGGRSATRPSRRRKREILGRAVSNVSAASSGSADSAGVDAAGPAPIGASGGGLKRVASGVAAGFVVADKTTPGAGGAELEKGDDGASHNAGDGGDKQNTSLLGAPPAATQLEYEDPEAKLHKAKLMHKMLGTVAGKAGGGASFSAAAVGASEKLTLGELGGYDIPQQQQRQYDYAAGSGEQVAGRRTRRRP
ncbi:hypothetical protein B0H66DRAFT_358203 [Apodospora peruviana]|uniref:BRCT domain-containing protein n=1 Tax=Apodospora peruviana TaxID=516989 RepID=A0AAE0LZS6_9PEZI|nr:hypothetical protein B0H66DRAFT_358203 [Apodospora peruviana]